MNHGKVTVFDPSIYSEPGKEANYFPVSGYPTRTIRKKIFCYAGNILDEERFLQIQEHGADNFYVFQGEKMISGRYASISGLQAYGVRIQNNANNVANMNTPGFKKGRVLLSEEKPQGVRARFERVETAGPPLMDESGRDTQMTGQSNVDLTREFPEMITNQHALLANIRSLHAADEMEESVLDMKA